MPARNRLNTLLDVGYRIVAVRRTVDSEGRVQISLVNLFPGIYVQGDEDYLQ